MTILTWTLAVAVAAAAGLLVSRAIAEALKMRHLVTIRNETTHTLDGFRLAFDNQPYYRDAPPIPSGASYVFDFEHGAEAAYIFSVVENGARIKLGGCGYTEGSLNAYVVTISALSDAGFQCFQVPGTGRWEQHRHLDAAPYAGGP
jgi:hypothetical protein